MRQEQISRKFGRLFYDASARRATLVHAIIRASAPFRADYSPLNSVVYLDFGVNPAGHDHEGTQKQKNDYARRAPRAARRDASRRAGIDLHAARKPGPSPHSTRPAAWQTDGASGLQGANAQTGLERLLMTGDLF